MNKRPKLGAVLRGGPANAAQETKPVPESPKAPQEEAKLVQLNVTVSADLRRAVRIKAMEQDREVAAVVRELLQRWLDES